MNRLHDVLSSAPPNLAAVVSSPLGEPELNEVLELADVIEMRADLFPCQEAEYLQQQAQKFGELPLLLTIRLDREGGTWTGSESDRLELFTELIGVADGVDIERDCEIRDEVIKLASKEEKVSILSRHDLKGIRPPADLHSQYTKSYMADYLKFACTVETQRDYDSLETFTKQHGYLGRLIAVGMGKFGPRSRVALPASGSRLTYAFTGGHAVAPGQMDLRTTRKYLDMYYPD